VTEPPCRVCGSSRDAHGTQYNNDHRYRAQRYCVTFTLSDGFTCSRKATWYVDGVPVCSYHKGIAIRENPDYEAQKIKEIVRYG